MSRLLDLTELRVSLRVRISEVDKYEGGGRFTAELDGERSPDVWRALTVELVVVLFFFTTSDTGNISDNGNNIIAVQGLEPRTRGL